MKIDRRVKHGLRNHPLYGLFMTVAKRCYNPKCKQYKNYGGRGITITDEWRNAPEKFIEWALVNGYESGLTLDRIDNSMGYSADNCRWVTREVQNTNKRTNVMFQGTCASHKAVELGGHVSTIRKRVQAGWSLEDAFTRPIRKICPKST